MKSTICALSAAVAVSAQASAAVTLTADPTVAPAGVDLRNFYDGVTLTVEDAADFGGVSAFYDPTHFVERGEGASSFSIETGGGAFNSVGFGRLGALGAAFDQPAQTVRLTHSTSSGLNSGDRFILRAFDGLGGVLAEDEVIASSSVIFDGTLEVSVGGFEIERVAFFFAGDPDSRPELFVSSLEWTVPTPGAATVLVGFAVLGARRRR